MLKPQDITQYQRNSTHSLKCTVPRKAITLDIVPLNYPYAKTQPTCLHGDL